MPPARAKPACGVIIQMKKESSSFFTFHYAAIINTNFAICQGFFTFICRKTKKNIENKPKR